MNFDKLKGMFTGVALGDSLGLPINFYRTIPKMEYSGLVNTTPFEVHWQFYSFKIEPASVSDDTMMTLALLKTLRNNLNVYDEDKVILAYEEFVCTQTNLTGKNTRSHFKGVKTVKGYRSRYNKLTDEDKEKMQSNGCLMRASPLVYIVGEEDYVNNIIKKDVYLTNPNEISYLCVKIFIDVLRILIDDFPSSNKQKIDKIKEYCETYIQNGNTPKEIVRLLIDAFAAEKHTRNILGDQKGWICNSLYIALFTLFNYNNFDDAMNFVISENPRSNTDTNASITGALFGALLGFENMNKEFYTSQNIKILDNELYKIYKVIEPN